MSERLTDAAIREAQAREPIAHEELMRVTGMGDWWCKRGEIRAHIPADPERDTDLVIGRSLRDVNALAAEALARGEELAAAERNAERLAACVSNGDGNIRRLEREAEALRAEVARLTRERDRAIRLACKMTQACIDSARHNRGATFSIDDSEEANTLHAMLSEAGLRAALDDTEGEACDVCPGTGWHEDREGRSVCVCIQETEAGGWLVEQVEKLKALLCNCDEQGGGHAPDCASSVREELEAAQEEIERLRAAAIPADAEERVARWFWDNRQDKRGNQTWAEVLVHAPPAEWPHGTPAQLLKEARAVLAALRRQA